MRNRILGKISETESYIEQMWANQLTPHLSGLLLQLNVGICYNAATQTLALRCRHKQIADTLEVQRSQFEAYLLPTMRALIIEYRA